MVAPQVEQAYGDNPQPPASQAETLVLQFLGVFFLAIIAEGLFLAVSVRNSDSDCDCALNLICGMHDFGSVISDSSLCVSVAGFPT